MSKYTVAAALTALLLLLVLAGGYAMSYRIDKADLPSDARLVVPDGEVAVGTLVKLEFDAVLPLRCRIGMISAELGDRIVISGTPDVKFSNYLFDRARYRVTLKCYLLADGMTTEGKIRIETNPELAGAPYFVAVAPFEIVKAKPLAELQLAGAVDIAGKSPYGAFYLWGIGALALLTVLAFYFRSRAARLETYLPSLQEKTLFELAQLRLDLERRKLSPVQAFVKLTDVVRIYLEKRFGIPASRSTTEEFFGRMSHFDAAMPEDEKPFLKEFMNAADLVKFARAEPDNQLLHNALDRAEQLVARTTPEEAIL